MHPKAAAESELIAFCLDCSFLRGLLVYLLCLCDEVQPAKLFVSGLDGFVIGFVIQTFIARSYSWECCK